MTLHTSVACIGFTTSTTATAQIIDVIAIVAKSEDSRRCCFHRVAVVDTIVAFSTLLAAVRESLASFTAEASAGITGVLTAATDKDCSQDENCWNHQFAL